MRYQLIIAASLIAGAVATTSARTTPSRASYAHEHDVYVSAKEYAFTAPDSIPAGLTEFHFTNKGTTLHHMWLLRLDDGKSIADLLDAMKANPNGWPSFATPMGGANAPVPGATSNATLVMQPGNYAIVCVVDLPDHVPHLMKGMSHPLTVTGPTSSATLPAARRTLLLKDFGFDLSQPLTPGVHTLLVKNNGPQFHEVELVQLAPGKTVQDLETWVDKMEGPPPARAIGGVAPLAANGEGEFTYNYGKGNYAFICFLPDANDGKPHYMHGMTMEFTIK